MCRRSQPDWKAATLDDTHETQPTQELLPTDSIEERIDEFIRESIQRRRRRFIDFVRLLRYTVQRRRAGAVRASAQ